MTDRNRASDCLVDLALVVHKKNVADGRVARLLGRPALPGHFGEFVAARVFDIELHDNAAHPGSDGCFRSGSLVGKSVNIKYYTKHDRLLDMKKEGEAGPGYYLVMTGPEEGAGPSRGKIRPWVIESVFLFDARVLMRDLKTLNQNKRIGIATYVPVALWNKAIIYRNGVSLSCEVTDTQRDLLGRFSETENGVNS